MAAGAPRHPLLTGGFVLLTVLLLFQVGLAWGGWGRSMHGTTDFRAFYGAGKLIAQHRGGSIYDLGEQAHVQAQCVRVGDRMLPFLYPAYAGLLFVPLAMLPYKAAFATFAATNLGLLALFGWWTRQEMRLSRTWSGWIVPLVPAAAVPVLIAVLQGQISLLLLVCYTAAHALLRRKQDVWAGLVLSLALVKFQIALPVLLLFFCWRQWRVVAGMLGGTIVLAAISVLVTGWAGELQYVRGTLAMAHATAATPEAAKAAYGMFAADMPNLHGLFFVLANGGRVGLWLTLLASLGVLLVVARHATSGVPAALCVGMLVSYHMQTYDLTLLLLPLVIGTANALRRAGPRWSMWLLVAAAAMLLAPVAPLIVYKSTSWILVLPVVGVLVSLEIGPDAPSRR